MIYYFEGDETFGEFLTERIGVSPSGTLSVKGG